MKLKVIEINGETYAAVENGKPVYVDDKGAEVSYDAPEMHKNIGRLNAEAKGHREAKEALEARLQALGDADPKAARQALETLANIDQKKLIDADKVAQIKAEAVAPLQAELDKIRKEKGDLVEQYGREKIGTSFASSKYIADNLAIPADMVQAAFGRHFEYADGKIVAKDGNGVPLLNGDGQPADFDTALAAIVATYPNRDAILKGSGHSGSGSSTPNGGGQRPTMKKAAFNQLNPHQKHDFISKVQKGEASLVD